MACIPFIYALRSIGLNVITSSKLHRKLVSKIGRESRKAGSNSQPFAFEINNKIIEKKTLVTDLIKRYYNQNKPITFYTIDRELNRKGDRSILNDYIRNYIDHPPENVILDDITWEKYEAFLKHLNAF